jgi:hypothetical protein
VAALEAAAGGIGMPLTVVEDGFTGGRERYGSRLLLVRPDQHVAWVGDAAPADPGALVRKLAGRD